MDMDNRYYNREWVERIDCLDFALQPIVNIHSGVCFGYEALLRNYAAAGFQSIDDVFDQASADNRLHQVDLRLREKAIEKYSQIGWCRYTKLFYNLDNRIFTSSDYQSGYTDALLKKKDLRQSNICFEISEKHRLTQTQKAVATFCAYRSQGFRIAVDDCGTGFSGLKLLYYAEPDLIKVDRFFIQDIETDAKKRLFVSSIVEIAHLMGSVVVAEGVETIQEFYGCRSIGCDLVQGFLVEKPIEDIPLLKREYQHIKQMSRADRRYNCTLDQTLINTELEYIHPLQENQDVIHVFEKFRENKGYAFFPIVSSNGEPIGVVRESSFKNYAYSRYGRQLIENPAIGKSLSRFISKFPVADMSAPLEKILKIFAHNEALEGLLMLENLKYKGFLSAQSLLKILNEKNLSLAREQNPLTKLPGNTIISEFISNALHDFENLYYFIYFDFDHFKVFNDNYGFRQGDRLILRFAELLSAVGDFPGKLVGHIGGDDFFMGLTQQKPIRVIRRMVNLAAQFKNDAESFYDPRAIQNGFIVVRGRDGRKRQFPLVTVSCCILILPPGDRTSYSTETVGNIMAKMKKVAKQSKDGLCIEELVPLKPKRGLRLVST
jgi:diguanylate cyclase (GGDEF)-like protein